MKNGMLPIIILAVISLMFPFANAESVPDWVKNTAGWWANNAISETEFVNAIEFLIKDGIIHVEFKNNCVEDISKKFHDREKIVQACKDYEILNSSYTELIPFEIKTEVNSKGFRGPEFSDKKPDDVFRIFMVGGSTMLSASTTNDSTIPGIMQKMFDSQNMNSKVEVINVGISGGNTISEYELISSKLVNYEPDLIIVYDGWNDLVADYPVSGIVKFWEAECFMAYENKFDLIITLQPIAGFGKKDLTNQEEINSLTGEDHNGFQLIQAKSTYDWLSRELEVLGNDAEFELGEGVCETHDLRNIFDDVNGPIYWDQGHMSNAGNFIVAEKMFGFVMNKIEPTFVPSEKFTEIISDYNNKSVLTYLLGNLGINDDLFSTPVQSVFSEGHGSYFGLKNNFSSTDAIFVGKDLTKFNLNKIDLTGQDLTGVNLSGQDLRDIDLSNSIIRGANFSYTNLEGKNFSGMDVRGINFNHANLKNADFRDSTISKTIQTAGNHCIPEEGGVENLIAKYRCYQEVIENESIRTSFTNADLTNAKFGSMKTTGLAQIIHFTDFQNANLSNVNFNRVNFSGTDFTNAKLNNILGNSLSFLKSDFTNVEMNNFTISEVWIQSSLFNDAEMKNGKFEYSVFVDVDLINTNLDKTIILETTTIGNNNFNCKNNEICN